MDRSNGLYQSFVHPFISGVLPFLFTLSLLLFIRMILPELKVIGFFLPVFLFLMAFVEGILGKLLDDRRSGISARFRELIVILLIVYFIYTLTDFRGIPDGFIPDIVTISALLLVSIQWGSSFFIYKRLSEREEILKMLHKIDISRDKHRLNPFSTETAKALRDVKLHILFLMVIVFLLLLISTMFIAVVDRLLLFSVVLFLFISIMVIGGISLYGDELYFAGTGLPVPDSEKKRRIFFLLKLTIAALVFSLLFVRPPPILPIAIVSNFFMWLFSLLQKSNGIKPEYPAGQNKMIIENPLSKMLSEMDNNYPGIDLSWFWLAMKIIGITALSLLFIGFLIRPLLKKNLWSSIRKGRIIDFFRRGIINILTSLRNLIVDFFRSLRLRERLIPSTIGRRDREGKGKKISLSKSIAHGKKKREMRMVEREFIRLLKWGRRHGVPWYGELPQEYTERLSGKFPTLTDTLDMFVFILEESLFSTHLISSKKLHSFRRALEKVFDYRE